MQTSNGVTATTTSSSAASRWTATTARHDGPSADRDRHWDHGATDGIISSRTVACRSGNGAGWRGVSAVGACLAILAGTVWVTGVYDPKPAEFLAETVPGRIFLALSLVSAMLFLAELAWRALLVYRYRPIAGCEDELLPDCTVVVPAFNEGKQVFLTLRSLAASDYPEERLELIAVDDGSVDDTWEWMKRAKEVLGDRVTILRQPRNTGKRHALHAGFRRSRGEVLVTVDSDSVVDADTLRNLVAPFVKDRMVGAVAGNLRVLNRDQGIIPRMLDVVFVYTSSYLRASQSMVKAVLCTPGALSAYRRSVVMGVMQEWLHQTFCGQPANIGEDRALTNLVLREGYHVLFQQNAWVHTEVPVTYANLCKMYLRWARGDLRETIALTRFAFKPFRDGSLLGVRINLISSWLTITCFQAALAVSLGLVILHPVTLGPGAFFGVVVSSTLAAAMYAWKFGSLSALWAFFYGAYSFVSLSWIGLYALMTPQKSGWLTRQLPSAPAVDRTGPLSAGSKMFLHEVNTAD